MFRAPTLIMIPFVDTLKIKSPGIVKILPRKNNRIQVSGMSIRNWVAYIGFVKYHYLGY